MPTGGKIGSADFSTNMGWTMDCPGQAGKFVQGTRGRNRGGYEGCCYTRTKVGGLMARSIAGIDDPFSGRLTVSLDRLDSPRLDKKDCWSGHWGSGSHANRGESAVQICAIAGSSGRIDNADFSTNMGWTMDCPGQAGKFVQGTR